MRPGVYRAVGRDGQEYLLHRSASQQLGWLTDLQRDVLRQLADSERSEESLRAQADDRAGDRGVAELDGLLRQLRTGGWLHITVVHDRPAYTIEPYRPPPDPPTCEPAGDLVLSRFAVIHRSGADLLIESPRSWCARAGRSSA